MKNNLALNVKYVDELNMHAGKIHNNTLFTDKYTINKKSRSCAVINNALIIDILKNLLILYRIHLI